MLKKEPSIETENSAPARGAAPRNWDALYGRIRELALRRSETLLAGAAETDEEFDRGARALRTLMSAAEVARRIKTAEEKDDAAHEETDKRPAFTDQELREAYETVTQQLERIEADADADSVDADARGASETPVRNGSGKDLGASRA